MQIPSGECSICQTERMEVKPGFFACPNFYGSPMHRCDPITFIIGFPDLKNYDEAIAKARTRLEEYCDCDLEEYIEARVRFDGFARELERCARMLPMGA